MFPSLLLSRLLLMWTMVATRLKSHSYYRIGEMFCTVFLLVRMATPSPMEPPGFGRVVMVVTPLVEAYSLSVAIVLLFNQVSCRHRRSRSWDRNSETTVACLAAKRRPRTFQVPTFILVIGLLLLSQFILRAIGPACYSGGGL